MENEIKEYRLPKKEVYIMVGITIFGWLIMGYLVGRRVDEASKYMVYILALAIGLSGTYIQIKNSKQYFTLEGNILKYYKNNREKFSWDINRIQIGYSVSILRKVPKYYLEIVYNGNMEKIPCTYEICRDVIKDLKGENIERY